MRTAYTIVPLLFLLTACAQMQKTFGFGHPQPQPQAQTAVVAPAAPLTSPDMSSQADDSAAGAAVPPGAGYVGAGIEPDAPQVVVKEVSPYQPIIIRVTGDGAAPNDRSLSVSQRRLLSLRAAKLDAFRAIAEQVQGMKLVGNSSVANMVSVSDSFRTYVDAFLRGVSVVSTSVTPDGSTEVIAEIVLDKDFYQQFKVALQQTGSVMKAAQQNGAQGVQCGDDNCGAVRYSSNFYNAQ